MTHQIGVYWAPGHNRQADLDYMAQLQPAAIRILDPDVMQISRAHEAAPGALILPRDWALSEQHDDMARDPVGTGQRHAREWFDRCVRWRSEAQSRGLPWPNQDQIVVVGINEPRVWEHLDAVVDYNYSFLEWCTELGLRACALNLSVGWPANTGEGTPPDWTPYQKVRNAIKNGDHYLCVHEYWYWTGPDDGWGWYAGRVLSCPWDVPIIIGECGVDCYVDAQRWQVEGGERGWKNHMPPETYAAQIAGYAKRVPVVAVLPFLTDYRDRTWWSFDTEPAHASLIAEAQKWPVETPNTVHLPYVSNGGAVTPENGDFDRVMEFILGWEGGYVNNPADPGGETNWGITKRSYPDLDIRNLTRDQALEIYRRDYWTPSGADALPWPACLYVMDTAVLHGVGTARQWWLDARGDRDKFLAVRLRSYTQMQHWHAFGAGWVRRVADLLGVK